MSKIDDLIKELCPNGVEWKKLGEVCQVLRGKRLTKSQLSDTGKYKVFHGGIEPIGFYGEKNREANTVMVINVGASAGTIGFSFEDFWSSDGCFCVSQSDSINSRFLYYFFLTIEYIITAKVRHAGIPTLDSKVIEDLLIPLPPLVIQEEIVRILDKFVEQQEQLEKLIELRKKQYEYYREELLTPKEGEEWETKTLGEIGKNLDYKRKPISSSKRIKGTYPYYGASGIVDYVEGYIFDGTYLLVSEDGANLIARSTPIAFSIEGKNWVNNHAHVIEIDDYNVRRLVETYLNSISIEEYISGGAQPKLNQENLNKITIPFPSKERLPLIIEALDSFESSIAELTSALEACKARYSHYRDQLLNFKTA